MIDAWLDARIRPPTSPVGKPVLVLCRTTATANTVRAWAARRTGFAGLEIATPSALAHQLDGPWLDAPPPGSEAAPDHPFAKRIGARPGLVALARQRVRELRLYRHANPDLPAPEWLESLAATDWHTDTALEARLLDLARANGPVLTASLQWSRVVAIGFDAPLDPWTRALVDAFVKPGRAAPVPRVLPTHGLRVPDTAAEARLAALHASVPDALVLVQHDATAARVHRALLRNGVPSAWRPPARLERHTLASVVRRAVPWFTGAADPPLRAVDLHFVLRHPMVDSRLPPPALTWLQQKLEGIDEDPTRTSLSPRAVARIVRRARHLDAPLSRWVAELDALSYRTDLDDGTPSRALRLVARLRVLQACIRGETFTQTFNVGGPEEDADWGDFDALVASLLGDQDPSAPPDIAEAGTLGALRRFLLACRLRTRDDPASLRILGALRRGAHQPATRTSALELLRGSVDRGEVRPGVEILTYEDYDGRPCSRLVLCDVHDQGVAVRPNPDPLLSEPQLEALGILHGRARVDFRLDQLQRAAGQAQEVVTLVAERDAMGRAVVPPVQMGLELTDACGAYGLDVADLPEARGREALRVRDANGEAPPEGPLQRAAVQVTAEWVRSGRGPVGALPRASRAPGRDTLAHLLVTRPTPPVWVLPWLGHAPDVPEAALEDREWSVTRLFRPLSHCMYQAFGRTVLGIREPETIAEELDAKEIGNAVHVVLEHAARFGAWSVDGDLESAREAYHDVLLRNTSSAFEGARREFGALSPAREAAAIGLEARWASQWSRYVEKRSSWGRDDLPNHGAVEQVVFEHLLLDAATFALGDAGRAAELPPASDYTLRQWIKSTAKQAENGTDPGRLPDHELCAGDGRGLPTAWAPTLRDFVKEPRFAAVVALIHDLTFLSTALMAPTLGVVAELPFGETDATASWTTRSDEEPARIGPLELQLGEQRVRVQGFIDRLALVGHPDRPLIRIVDYKTGRSAPDEKSGRKQLLGLVEPQLVVYALAVQAALARDPLDLPAAFANARVASVGWDHLLAVDENRKLLPARDGFLVDPATLNLLARALGSLVGRARSGDWLLSPRADTCPTTASWKHDHCPLAGACRLRDVEGELP
ncbi:MAG: PD-(D/E)XK nuclease family protein [Myxococcota bacterium]